MNSFPTSVKTFYKISINKADHAELASLMSKKQVSELLPFPTTTYLLIKAFKTQGPSFAFLQTLYIVNITKRSTQEISKLQIQTSVGFLIKVSI